jgi:mannitol/fructose-specific phosphotransferase system IIA component (Ntr-type)
MLHIKGAKLQYTNQATHDSYPIGAEEILDIVDRMIDVFDSEIAYELKLDEEFIHGLLVHLEPTFIRLKNKMNIYNPILKDIKEEYPEIFAKCKKTARVITEKTGFPVNEEEIGYLTMHFGAAVERINNQRHKERCVEIGVICASGFGVARLMLTKLQNHLNKQVSLHAFGKDELTPYITSKIDFFVTSIDLDYLGVDYIHVSPLIPAKDLQLIQCKVNEYSRMPEKMEKNDFTRQLEAINFTAAKIKLLIKRYQDIRIARDSTFQQMLTIISNTATNKATSSIILREDLLARESLMSQIFPELKIALLHCRTKAVDEVAFYTCRAEDGKEFLDPYLKKIQTAVVLLMPIDENRQQNSQMLGYISSSLIEDEEFMDCILYQSEEKIREKLQVVLKNYFNNYIGQI